jgi:hypothetical protein
VGGVTVNLYQATDENSASGPLVEGTKIGTTQTDGTGFYFFNNLPLGSYFVEFVPPAGFALTQSNVQNNGQDALDSDAAAPVVNISVSDGGVKAELGKPLSYTISYENVDQVYDAVGVVLSSTVPAGTVADLAASTPGWSCSASPAIGGAVCTLAVGPLAAGAQGSAQFVVVVGSDDATVPTNLALAVSVTHSTPGRSHVTTPPANGSDPTLDAGLVLGDVRQRTGLVTVRTPGIPTGLDDEDQPGQPRYLFLPAVDR